MADADVELVPAGRYEWERIIRRAVLPGPVKLLALTMATYADPDGSRVRPGQDVLASVVGASERTVRRILRDLSDSYRLIEMVSRGGGRGGSGKKSVYRLVLPTDLFDRVRVLDPGERRGDSPDIHVSGHSTESADTQVSGQSDATEESPDTIVAGQSGQSPVDSAESADTQVSPENDFHRSSGVASDRLTGHLEPIDRTPGCPTTTQRPTTTEDHPLGSSTSATHDRARDESQPGNDDSAEVEVEPAPPPARCPHGLVARTRPEDGLPSCALCRREQTREAS